MTKVMRSDDCFRKDACGVKWLSLVAGEREETLGNLSFDVK